MIPGARQATFAARHNTVFQGLAADGAKLALWQLWRAGYRIANFVHDEVLIELPAGGKLALHAEIVRRLMINAMRGVVPDVRVDVQYARSDRWAKDAEVYFDEGGEVGGVEGSGREGCGLRAACGECGAVKEWKKGFLNVAYLAF